MTRRRRAMRCAATGAVCLGALAGMTGAATADPRPAGSGTPASTTRGGPTAAVALPAVCAPDPEPPEYYAFPLVTTRNVPGTARTRGTTEVTFARSPFGITVAPDGSYVYDLHLTLERLPPPPSGVYTVWVTRSDLSEIERLGVLDGSGTFRGRARWNKFLVVISLEDEADPDRERWGGPIVMRGMSRSGMMHTMAGHGPFQQENCAAYGYDG